ncbi:hypothetical protein H480_05339 [Amycolatopsis vancoresmycina DSM 44592]|uniref:Uncharacterized protein n=1 Tax=Amycolatopsis vancoresmycina DSM 44592 TaxID=1292037 RepID=R1GE78_9PSEU|nr:hypothetical protein H480_05339 [Amycolatopsis vancoresmycina DSM 44592]
MISLSAGTCYWPGCPEPIVREVEGTYKIALEIAHICALIAAGERYDPRMTDDERNAFENLIFLCHPHHQVIDEKGAAKKWPVDLLRQWKTGRERDGIQQLRGLRYLTEDRLAEIINLAIEAREDDIKRTLARLEQSDVEAAALLKELRAELNAARTASSPVNLDAAELLYHAATNLSHLGDNAEVLNNAAGKLVGLEDSAHMLRNAAEDIRRAVQSMGDYR